MIHLEREKRTRKIKQEEGKKECLPLEDSRRVSREQTDRAVPFGWKCAGSRRPRPCRGRRRWGQGLILLFLSMRLGCYDLMASLAPPKLTIAGLDRTGKRRQDSGTCSRWFWCLWLVGQVLVNIELVREHLRRGESAGS